MSLRTIININLGLDIIVGWLELFRVRVGVVSEHSHSYHPDIWMIGREQTMMLVIRMCLDRMYLDIDR
jgi:hypothetical protein